MLKVATIQQNLVWEDAQANQDNIQQQIAQLSEKVDLIILPEMFNSGFTMNPNRIAQTTNGESVQWLQAMSQKYQTAIIGSIAISENNNYYNRLFVFLPDNRTYTYNKKHLFRMGGEHNEYTEGKQKLIFEYKGWRICPLICYDLRFPVWSRNTNNYDLLIYIASWPAVRNNAWQTLLQARAIENQCYTIGVNRIGTDGNQLEYMGNSLVINYKGDIITQMDDNTTIAITELKLNELNDFKEKFPSYLDADKFTINAHKEDNN